MPHQNSALSNRTLAGLLIPLLILLLFTHSAWALETPSNMMVTGTINGRGALKPLVGDKILALNKETGALEETGEVHSRQGLFSIVISKNSGFNETTLVLQLEQHGERYDLETRHRKPAEFIFQGGLVPTRISLKLRVVSSEKKADAGGGHITKAPSPGASTAPVATPKIPADLNDDGQLNQADINIVKDVVAGKIKNERADINGDNIINTRDIISIIRLVDK